MKYIMVAIVFLLCGVIVGTEIITVAHDKADVLGLTIERWQYSNKVDGADSLRYVIKYDDVVLYRGMPQGEIIFPIDSFSWNGIIRWNPGDMPKSIQDTCNWPILHNYDGETILP